MGRRAGVDRHRSFRRHLCSGPATHDGRQRSGHSRRQGLHRDATGWQREHPVPVPAERGLPRRGRCPCRTALTGAGERAQHRARPVLHFRTRTFSGTRCDRRRGGDNHRSWCRRSVPVLVSLRRQGPARISTPQSRDLARADCPHDSYFDRRHRAIPDCHVELDRNHSCRRTVRQRPDRGLHDRYSPD
jgi:hypothetical protein